jgi:Fe-S cluster assembly iron-binding protein IscA
LRVKLRKEGSHKALIGPKAILNYLGGGFKLKKVVSLFMIVALLLSLAIPVAAQGEKQGVIKSFTAKSITLGVDGKNYTYTIDSKTEVKKIDQNVDLMDAAKKGIKVAFKNSGNKLTYINIPNTGAEMQGVAKIAVSDVRINPTDSALAAESTTSVVDGVTGEVTQTTVTKVKKLAMVDCDEYVYDDQKNLTLGDIVIDPASLKVALNGKSLKVITDGKTDFDPSVVGDEVKLVATKTMYTMVFEGDITANKDAVQADIEKLLKVSYKKQNYEISTTETNFLTVEKEALVELNGKEVPLNKAMDMSNYWFITTNPEGNAIHINSFYREVKAVFTGLSKTQLTVNILKDGKVVGSDTLTPSAGLTVLAADGKEISLKDLKVNDKLTLTTEPADGYKVTFIQKH